LRLLKNWSENVFVSSALMEFFWSKDFTYEEREGGLIFLLVIEPDSFFFNLIFEALLYLLILEGDVFKIAFDVCYWASLKDSMFFELLLVKNITFGWFAFDLKIKGLGFYKFVIIKFWLLFYNLFLRDYFCLPFVYSFSCLMFLATDVFVFLSLINFSSWII